MVQRRPTGLSIFDLLEKELGTVAYPNENPEGSTLGTTAARLLIGNVNRIAFLIYNLSANVLFIAPNREVATTRGIRIGPSQGVMFIWKEDLSLPSSEWWGVMDAGAAQQLYILEMVTA